MKQFRAAATALVGPLTPDGTFDAPAYEKLLEFQIREGIGAVVSMGTTFGSPTFALEHHKTINELTIELVAGKIPVICGGGSNNLAEAMELSLAACKAGAFAILAVDPYYNGPASYHNRQLYHGRLAELIARENPDCAYWPYIIPGRTGCKTWPVDLAILADQFPNVTAVKEATGDLENMRQTRQLFAQLDQPVSILSGDDDLTAKMFSDPGILADGVISVVSNLAPAAVAQMVQAFLEGKVDEGNAIAVKLAPLFKLVTITDKTQREFKGQLYQVDDKFRNPCGIQTAMAGIGMINANLREPLGLMSSDAVEQVRVGLQQVWKHTPEILAPIQEFYGVDINAQLTNCDLWAKLSF
ncbi:MAG: dihydrodipicolinate synthase family protein [Candidatus Buchananbacteria bacterium]